MAYIDYEYYFDEYKGIQIDEDTFFSLVERATDIIDQITNDGIHAFGFEHLHTRIKDKIKKATAAQVEYMQMNGGVTSVHGNGDFSSVSIGNFSYSEGNVANSVEITSPAVINHLRGTGLLYKGVCTHG